jgi:AmmeMemoRadiSam system protein B
MTTAATTVRTAVGAGRWFPGRAAELKKMVEGYIAAAENPRVAGRIVAGIAPHAGYIYSGKVAGHVFRAARDQATDPRQAPETAVVLGFVHRTSFSGVALMDGQALRTPLAETPLDAAAGEELVKASAGCAQWNYAPHNGEWSAENEIPFVQAALPQARLVVGLFGDHDPRSVSGMARALQQLAAIRRILVIASSDMLHDPDYEKVGRTDRQTLETTAALDAEALQRQWSYERQIYCGLMPVLTVMRWAAQMGCRQGQVLHYRNSGDDYPESRGEWVVGYGAVVFAVPEGEARQ